MSRQSLRAALVRLSSFETTPAYDAVLDVGRELNDVRMDDFASSYRLSPARGLLYAAARLTHPRLTEADRARWNDSGHILGLLRQWDENGLWLYDRNQIISLARDADAELERRTPLENIAADSMNFVRLDGAVGSKPGYLNGFLQTITEVDGRVVPKDGEQVDVVDMNASQYRPPVPVSVRPGGAPHSPPPLFLAFPTKARLLLNALWNKNNVPIKAILRAVWGENPPKEPEDTLHKLKTRVNKRLITKNLEYEIKREGGTYKLSRL